MHTFKHTQPKKEQIIRNKKWAKFTYVGRETRHITKLFKESTIRPSFTTNNTIMKVLNIKTEQRISQYDNSGIYQLTYPDCQKKYIGQTGDSFKISYSEHFRDFKYNNNKSKFAQHLLEHKHSMGPIDTVMEILHMTNKGQLMDTLEKHHIYKETQINNQINDKCTVKPNVIFDAVVQHQSKQRTVSATP
jgi:hypothetical protein